jgi:DNA-directed RNA polymerase
LSYTKRLEWTNENLDKIIQMRDVTDDNANDFNYDFILEAKEPLLFLSCCVEISNYYSDPANFISCLPVYLDATCSGLQHLSAMMNDTNLAQYVNIVNSNKDDIPNDVYSHMVTFVNQKIQDIIEINPNYAILNNININRNFIKRGIMTIPYGVSSRGIADQLKTDHFKKMDLVKGNVNLFVLKDKEFNKTPFDIFLTLKQISVLGSSIHSVLYDTFPNLTILVKYLKDMNSLLKKLKISTV